MQDQRLTDLRAFQGAKVSHHKLLNSWEIPNEVSSNTFAGVEIEP